MHLTPEAFVDLLEGHGDTIHTDECSDCRHRLQEWRQLHSRLGKNQLLDAPATLLNAAYGIMEPPRPKIGEILASIVFDSFTQPAFAGARGAGAARQVVLRAAEFDVHVKISGPAESRQIAGQILAREENGFIKAARVHLLHDGERIQSVILDKLGEFEFENTPEGLLSLQIDLPNFTVIGALGTEEGA